MNIADLDTPALLVDLDIMEANIARTAKTCRDAGINWRPHIKGQKTPEIVKKELAAGAIGATCAKLGEAEIMAAAGITDLLQTTVATGTGKAAQIGRPVAGKTGTTSSNKDGYFVGFSSGLTTGVWMGRDDSRAVGGLQGGTAPARAFASFMRRAVQNRPIEKFDTDLKLPDWQLEPDDEALQGNPDDYYFVDDDGNLIEPDSSDVLPPPRSYQEPPVNVRRGNGEPVPPAASEDFIGRAIGDGPGEQP